MIDRNVVHAPTNGSKIIKMPKVLTKNAIWNMREEVDSN
jgi:hypothetical protein